VVTEVGSALNGHRRKFLSLLNDPKATVNLVEHRDRFCRFGAEYLEAALSAQARRLAVIDSAEVDNDLVRNVTELLTSLCAGLFGQHPAVNRAKKAIDIVCAKEVP
jgi:predicted site-specific integrase-resolvase